MKRRFGRLRPPLAQDAGMGKTEAQQEKYHMDIGEILQAIWEVPTPQDYGENPHPEMA